jgi:hypothetical protein
VLQLAIDPEVRLKVRSLAEVAARLGSGPLYDYVEPAKLHVALNAFNRARLQPCLPSDDWEAELPFMHAAELVEARFVEEERAKTRAQVASVSRDPAAFVEWFVSLKEKGPGQYDPFFDFLAKEASRAEIQYFIKQEYCGEIGFDDLIALTQVRLPERAKLELARNYWDEQGRGNPEDLHGPMYVAMAHELGVKDTPDGEFIWETLALANMLTALAYNRRYTWHSLGAMSVIELTSPTRASRIAEGLGRVGLSDNGCRYFQLHSVIDLDHWSALLEEVISPLVSSTPELCVPLAEGALMRLNAGAELIERYRAELGLDSEGRRIHSHGSRP